MTPELSHNVRKVKNRRSSWPQSLCTLSVWKMFIGLFLNTVEIKFVITYWTWHQIKDGN